MASPRLLTLAPLTALALLGGAALACRSERNTQQAARNDTGTELAPPPSGTASESGDTGMSAMNQADTISNPDHQFLRMMSDHHEGLLLMAHDAERRGITVKAEARKFDKEQSAQINQMLGILKSRFKDDYTPRVGPDNQALADSLTQKSGAAFDTTFRENIIKHHQGALQMVAQYLPKLENPEVRQLAQNIKTTQTAEIAQLKRELGQS